MTSHKAVTLTASHVDFGYGTRQVLHNVNLTVHAGARLGIVGESGSGKTTLANLLVGALDPRGADVTVNGKSWSKVARQSGLRRAVQMIHQDPFASLNPHMTAHAAVREAAHVCRGCSRQEAKAMASDLLSSVGIDPRVASRRPGVLSGGQCQRVAIARALAANPAVIIADEPTSALDLSVQAQILNLLMDVMEKRDTALVLVSHDLAVIRHITEEIIVMKQGTVLERGTTSEVLADPQHPYTQELVANAPWVTAEANV